MTSEARAALREKVITALDETFLLAARRGMWNVSREHDCAVAAIDVVLEEAARVAETKADEWCDKWRKGLKCDSYLEGMSDGADDVAAAIRGMIGKD